MKKLIFVLLIIASCKKADVKDCYDCYWMQTAFDTVNHTTTKDTTSLQTVCDPSYAQHLNDSIQVFLAGQFSVAITCHCEEK